MDTTSKRYNTFTVHAAEVKHYGDGFRAEVAEFTESTEVRDHTAISVHGFGGTAYGRATVLHSGDAVYDDTAVTFGQDYDTVRMWFASKDDAIRVLSEALASLV